jgi:hypothetical protein
MRKSRLLLLTALLTIGFVAPGLLLTLHHLHLGSPAPLIPITFCYVPDYDARGALSDYPSFWVTNYTEEVLTVSLTAIESRVGSNWIPLTQFGPPLLAQAIYFQTERGRQLELGPHEAAYGELDYGQRIVLPTEVPWRVKVSVAERVAGLSSDMEASRRLVMLRLRTGNTNVPWHVMGTGHPSYRYKWNIVSQEVSPERAVKEPKPEVLATGQAAGPFTRAAPEAIEAARAAVRDKLSQLAAEPEPVQPLQPASK